MSTMTTTTDLTWESATTLAELGELTARWLEGELPETPSYGGSPDEETAPLIERLAAANRAGYVTSSSQPGHGPQPGYGDVDWAQRAAVNGIADRETAQRLVWQATLAGLWVLAAGPRNEDGLSYPATTRDGKDYTVFGYRPWTDLVWDYDAEDTELETAIGTAYQVTIIDPEFRDSDLLWHTLASALDLDLVPADAREQALQPRQS